jgi:uncharacterized membrane protein
MGLTGATILLCLVLTGAVVGIAVLRRRTRDTGRGGSVAEAQRRSLAANWDAVERAAVRGGMDAEQLAEVRRRVLGG